MYVCVHIIYIYISISISVMYNYLHISHIYIYIYVCLCMNNMLLFGMRVTIGVCESLGSLGRSWKVLECGDF